MLSALRLAERGAHVDDVPPNVLELLVWRKWIMRVTPTGPLSSIYYLTHAGKLALARYSR